MWRAWRTLLAAGPRAVVPPAVAIHVVRLASERPDLLSRSLSQWGGHELARQLVTSRIVADISASTVRRMLAAHQLKPWRPHLWLHPKHSRDAGFDAAVAERIALYTCPRREDAMGLALDEKASRQPRPRPSPTLPAQPHNRPNRLEHAYQRAGALHLFTALDTRSRQVYGPGYDRTRQAESLAFLEHADREVPATIRTMHLVCDHVSPHHGQEVTRWIAQHPRVVGHFTPVHGSWMHHVDQWLSLWQRKRLRISDLASTDHLRAKIDQFIQEWNQ